MAEIPIMTVMFRNRISNREVAMLRGAVASAVGFEEVLLHNHPDRQMRYSYPLVQYKSLDGRAAIVCVGEGLGLADRIISLDGCRLWLGDRSVDMALDTVVPESVDVSFADDMIDYRICDWLPLNSDNYQRYIACSSAKEKISILENLLVGNILSFAKGMGIFLEYDIECEFVDFPIIYESFYKGNRMLSFDVIFRTNLILGNRIGLGKGASIGHGTITRLNNNK